MGGSQSMSYGGAITPKHFKAILMNGVRYKNREQDPLIDTEPYIMDEELSNDYAQVYVKNGENEHVIINHRATDGGDSSEIYNLGTYIISEALYKATTTRFSIAKDTQMKAVDKYDIKYKEALTNNKIQKKQKHLYSIISTIGFSQGGALAEYCGEGSYEIITFNEASKPKAMRALFRKIGYKFESGYTPIIRIRTDGDVISYFNKNNMAITLPQPELTPEQEKNKTLSLHQASNMNISNYGEDSYFGVSGLGDSASNNSAPNNNIMVYSVDNNTSNKVLRQKRCIIS